MARTLNDEQQARIAANRKRALDRLLGKRKNTEDNSRVSASASDTARVTSTNNNTYTLPIASSEISSKYVTIDSDTKRRQLTLTQEQQLKIEANRQKALEIRERLNGLSSTTVSSSLTNPAVAVIDNIRLNKNQKDADFFGSSKFVPPPIKSHTYIEYDFSTMQDSKGGFLEPEPDGEVFDPYKDDEKNRKRVIYDEPPPTDPNNAPKCVECQSIDIDKIFQQTFNVNVCRNCKKEFPDKYSLLTKTECREDYLLTEPELADQELLARIEKANPHGFSKMQLFLRLQIEEFAWKKWGGADKLDEEWERRETNKLKRKEKKYRQQLLEMRKKTRAEEFTRKMRNGHNLGERHVHDWSAPLSLGNNMIKKRCIDCGVEIEEVII